jgi:sugar O-acyltransferase (sialic acid O-acetyltransferase NeuD family)
MMSIRFSHRRKQLYILGAGGHGLSLGSVAIQSGFKSVIYLDSLISAVSEKSPNVFPLLDILKKIDRASFAIAVGENHKRRELHNYLEFLSVEYNVDLEFPNIVHPKSSIGNGVQLGVGNHIFPFSSIGAHSSISDFVILNHHSSLDHQSQISSYASLAPGAITGGNVSIGEESALLISSSVAPRISIGVGSVLGANSFLKENLGDYKLFAGSPAQFVRDRLEGEDYL